MAVYSQCKHALPSEFLVNVDNPEEAAEWVKHVYPNEGFVVPVFSYNLHEARGYNRLASLARGDVVVIVQVGGAGFSQYGASAPAWRRVGSLGHLFVFLLPSTILDCWLSIALCLPSLLQDDLLPPTTDNCTWVGQAADPNPGSCPGCGRFAWLAPCLPVWRCTAHHRTAKGVGYCSKGSVPLFRPWTSCGSLTSSLAWGRWA